VATVKTYATTLRATAHDVSLKLGYDVRQADLPMRAVLTTVCVLIGGVLRILFTKGLATDAEMNTVFTGIRSADYPQLPASAPVVTEDNLNPAPPDLGA
jgi:hypothetical protein